jgi:hypothetical protein
MAPSRGRKDCPLGQHGLSIDVGRQYAIDFNLAPASRTASRLKFNTYYTHGTMISTLLEVISHELGQQEPRTSKTEVRATSYPRKV